MKTIKIGFIGVTSRLLFDEFSKKTFEESKKLVIESVKPNVIAAGKDFFDDSPEGVKKHWPRRRMGINQVWSDYNQVCRIWIGDWSDRHRNDSDKHPYYFMGSSRTRIKKGRVP
ncbi:hypothetical protein ES703_72495 [subsurface metagenome]